MYISLKPPSWQQIGDLLIDQLKHGNTEFALEVVPMMVEKLVLLEKYAVNGKVVIKNGKAGG